MTNTLPHITAKQQQILHLLYTYRFLNTTHIQQFLHHKDNRRIKSWLKDLREKDYINWHYDPSNITIKIQPAIYFLGLPGIQHLAALNEQPSKLQKRYKDSTLSKTFIDRCLLVADCCLTLHTKSDTTVQYDTTLPADYASPDHPLHHLTELSPHLYFSKHQGDEITRYVFENLERTLPRYQLRKRCQEYVEYLEDADEPHSLIALFACDNTAELLYLKRYFRRLIADTTVSPLQIRVAKRESIQATTIASNIWEDME